MAYSDYKVDVPEGKSGAWQVSKFSIGEQEASQSRNRALLSGGRGVIPEGSYTSLKRNGYIIMSDTPDEIRDHIHFIHQAHGYVLIHGLGIGMCMAACLRKEQVTHVTVVEKSPDVIKLVGPWAQAKAKELGTELEIIEGDAYTWKPPTGAWWNVVWHDIWDDLCTDNLKLMTKLHRRFGRRSDWQDSWGKDYLKREQRAENSQRRF